MQRLAVIDLGTNTFHLLIADATVDGTFLEVFRQRQYVYLGEEGVEKLGETPMNRAFQALLAFKEKLQFYNTDRITAIGTAALRTASNGQFFMEKVKTEIGIEIQTINGNREAELIYYGVRQAVPMPAERRQIIMDIGGGSVEFIIADGKQIFWAESFPIGVSVLYNRFHHSEPIANTEFEQIEQYLIETLSPLWQALRQFPTQTLIGASGTFDVLADSIGISSPEIPHGTLTDLALFPPIYERVVAATYSERLAMPDIPQERAKLITVALILIETVVKKGNFNDLVVSNYAMKEGILWELLHQ